MSKKYGIPYMGSKGSILKKLCGIFPNADNFYDLFGGGFSVSHFMYEHRKNHYKQFHFNEIRKGVPELIKDAIAGKYNYEVYKPKFVNREEFFKRLEIDPMIKLLWSFGNNGKDYLFSKEIEPYKKSMHNAIIFNEFNDLATEVLQTKSFNEGYSVKDKRFYLRNKIEWYRANKAIPEVLYKFIKDLNHDNQRRLQQLQQLQQLEQLEQLLQLERLQRLEQLEFYNTDYRNVPIKENSIIYCDPPYMNAAEYDKGFNHKEFYDWAASQSNPVFISEYQLKDDRFKCILNIKKRVLLADSSTGTLYKTEKVFINKAAQRALFKK